MGFSKETLDAFCKSTDFLPLIKLFNAFEANDHKT